MYGGGGAGFFMKSCMSLMTFMTKVGIKFQPYFIFNESLVTRARNYIADEFMRSDCTHLLFIDADIEYAPEDVITLLHFAETKNLDVTCGPYAKKNISWEKIVAAVNAGKADENPNILSQYAGDYVFSPLQTEFTMDQPLEVRESGTGFMLIKRKVMEDFALAYPELHYYPDHKRSKDFGGDRKIVGFFMDPIDEERHLSEDYFFCKWARKIGKRIWILPWLKLNHFGNYNFEGNLEAILSLGLAPQIKEEDVKKVQQ
jgi:hypothetical protein